MERRGEATPNPLDWDSEWRRAAAGAGGAKPISRSIVRTIYSAPGSGWADSVRLDGDAMANVINCVTGRAIRWPYRAEEPLIMLRASLACDVSFRYGTSKPIVFNRPEVLLACLPEGVTMVADIIGNARQQGLVAIFRAATFARRFGLQDEDLPAAVREVVSHTPEVVRLSSFPIDARIGAIIAETIDSRVHGELRVAQLAGRIAELVVYALDAMLQPAQRAVVLPRRRDLELAQRARDRLDREYRHPPAFADLAGDIGVSLNKLKSVFKEAFGTTMADHCLDRRIREAQQLLLDGTLTIAQVAERVGYEHQSSFTAAFGRHVGMSPREYRRHRAPFMVEIDA